MMKRVLCVWLPNWPLQRLFAAQPELKGRPVVLYNDARLNAGSPGLHVLICSRQAALQGVEAGLTLAEARGMFEVPASPIPANQIPVSASSPGTHDSNVPYFLEHDPRADACALEQLAVCCQRFSPRVGFGESHWVTTHMVKLCTSAVHSKANSDQITPEQYSDTLLLDITGCAHLFRGEMQLVDEVVEEMRRHDLRAEVVVADTIGASWAIAHFQSAAGPLSRLQSAVRERDHESRIVPPGEQFEYLRDLPVTALRLELRILETLGELDLCTIGQLYDLPRGSLPSRFGNQITHRLDEALGKVIEQIVPVQPTPIFETSCNLAHSICHHDALSKLLLEQMGQLVDQLRFRQEGVQRLQGAR